MNITHQTPKKENNQNNKSATMPHNGSAENKQEQKPKKKSKLSFLNRKKNKD
jgi:hypothetical protein